MKITVNLSIILLHLVFLGSQVKTNKISKEDGKENNSLQNKLDSELKNLIKRGKISFPRQKPMEKNKEQSNMRQTSDVAHFLDEIATAALGNAQIHESNKNRRPLFVDEKSCPFRKIKCDKNYRYRSVDGTCNNLDNPLKGSSNTPYKRILLPAYDDNLNSPRSKSVSGENLPNPRTISLNLSPPSNANSFEKHASQIYALFGQFFIHDSALTSATSNNYGSETKCTCESNDPACFSVAWPPNDMYLDQKCMKVTRSSATFPDFDCSISYREQLNLLSSFIDGSAIYGLDKQRSDELRTFYQGLMKTSEPTINGVKVTDGSYLPLSDDTCSATEQTTFNCFKAGEVRTSENLALVSMHTLFLREHNRVAKILANLNPSWNDERLYQETRNIVIAILQHIIYNEWLPMVIGDTSLSPDLTKNEYYSGYNSDINPAIANEFSTAAFRFGHSLIRDKFTRYNSNDDQINSINFTDMVFKSDYAYNFQGQGIQSIVKGTVNDNCKRFGSFGNELQNKLFGKIENKKFTAIDLFATNIQRGRDHGLRPYVDYVKLCHGIDVSNFEDLSSLISSDNIQKLQSVYENVADIDLYAGGLMENKVSERTLAAKTFGCIIMRQFADLKNGDRFYYENGPLVNPSAFTLDQLSQIKKVTMSGLLCNNYEFSSLAQQAFLNPSSAFQSSLNPILSVRNKKVSCSVLKNQIDFTKWKRKVPIFAIPFPPERTRKVPIVTIPFPPKHHIFKN